MPCWLCQPETTRRGSAVGGAPELVQKFCAGLRDSGGVGWARRAISGRYRRFWKAIGALSQAINRAARRR